MKLIEANRAKECASTLFTDPILKMAVNAVVDNCPGFELVRCKDCKHYVLHALACLNEHMNGVIQMNGFCSYGERRTDGKID